MPRWRKLHVKATESLDINEMPDDFTRVLWLLLPLAMDCEGRGLDNSGWVKARAMPLREDVTLAQVQEALGWFDSRGMIERYEVEGRRYFWLPSFSQYQGDTSKEAESLYPTPPGQEEVPTEAKAGLELVESESRVGQELVQSRSGVGPELVGSRSGSDADADADADAEENQMQQQIQSPAREPLLVLADRSARIPVLLATAADLSKPADPAGPEDWLPVLGSLTESIFPNKGPINAQELQELIGDLGHEGAYDALRAAGAAGATSWAYVRAISERIQDEQREPEPPPEPRTNLKTKELEGFPWPAVLEHIGDEIQPVWLEGAYPIAWDHGTLRVKAKNGRCAAMLDQRFSGRIAKAVGAVMEVPGRVRVLVE